MQKRSSFLGAEPARKLSARINAEREFAPVNLPADFPVSEPDPVTCTSTRIHRPHIHECFELGYCYEGQGLFLVENKILPCRKGDAIVVNHHETHVLLAPTPAPTRWKFINLSPEALLAPCALVDDCAASAAFSGPDFCNVISAAKHPELCELVRLIIAELLAKKGRYRAAVRALVWALMVKLHRLTPAKSKPRRSVSASDTERLKPALRYIAEHYTQQISVSNLARLCHCSAPNFRRVFKRQMGSSCQTYLLRFRVEVAKMLLQNSDNPILDISLRAGFASLSNFNRQFKARTGRSPREWRKQVSRL